MTLLLFFFFFNATATTEIYTLSLHDALPIYRHCPRRRNQCRKYHGSCAANEGARISLRTKQRDRKSTRLNSSHANISYAVFCLKKKKKKNHNAYIRLSVDCTSKSSLRHSLED